MSVVLDFEGFQLKQGKFIVKEMAAYAVNDPSYRGRWLFQPPHSFQQLPEKNQRSFSWVSRNIHHLSWSSGQLPYTDLEFILRVNFRLFKKIYVKGLEKKNFLEKISKREIINLDDLDCPPMRDLPPVDVFCPYMHIKNFDHCSVQKAAAFGRFLEAV